MLSRSFIPLLLLLSFSVVFSECKKSNTARPSYTAKMGRVRNWHGSHFYQASGMHFPTSVYESYAYPDTSFAVTIVSDSAVNLMGITFKYDQTDTAKKIYYFGSAYDYYLHRMGLGVAYYYARDSMVYCDGVFTQSSDFIELKNLYYTY